MAVIKKAEPVKAAPAPLAAAKPAKPK